MTHPLHDTRGEQKEQRLILVDQSGNEIGTDTREACHAGNGKTHRAFLAFVVTPDHKVVLTQRSRRKSLWGGYWDASVVSHVLPGETPEQATARRAKEELGIHAEFSDLGAFYYFAPHGDSAENEYCHVLVGRTTDSVHPNPVEIDAIQMITPSELPAFIAQHHNTVAPWLILAVEKFGHLPSL